MIPTESKALHLMLRLEGAAFFVAATTYYATLSDGWLLYAALALLPDVTMLAYLAGPRVGARVYNLGHSYLAPLLAGVLGMFIAPALVPVAAIWVAHIGADRALGYGLKHSGGFNTTHLGPIGADKPR